MKLFQEWKQNSLGITSGHDVFTKSGIVLKQRVPVFERCVCSSVNVRVIYE